jgi:tetratricopeptide (TPR) repeat protein
VNQRKLTRKERSAAQRKNVEQPTAVRKAKKVSSGLRMEGLVIAVLAFLLYSNSLRNDFALDDISAIKKNWVVKQGVSSIRTILTTSYRFGYRQSDDELYRPLPLIIFAALWQMAPGNPFPFHLLNVILYAVTGLVLFHLLKRILGNVNPLLPFIATVLFIVHPLHTEVVANIKSLDEILSFLFVLLCIRQLFIHTEKKSPVNLFYAWLFFFLAFLCKEGTVVMLVAIPLILLMFANADKKYILKTLAVLSSAAVVFILMRAHALGGFAAGKKFLIQENVLVSAPGLGVRLATIFYVLFLYIRLMVFPHPLSSDYSFKELELSSWSQPLPWVSLLFYAGIALIAFRLYRKNKIISFAIFFFLCTISLYSNLLMTIGSLFAERFLYVPLLGLTIVLAWLILKVFKIPIEASAANIFTKQNQKPIMLLLVLMIPCCDLTVARNADWRDTVTLFSKDVVNAPNSALLHYNYANELKAEKAEKEKDPAIKSAVYDSAIYHYKKALEIYPGYNEVFEQLGLAYYYRGMDSAAFEYVKKAIEAEPLRSTAYNSLGTLYFEKAKDYQKALELYLHSVQLNPNYIDGWRNVGAAYGTLGKFDQALDAFRQVLRLDPVNVTVLNFISQTYRTMGDESSADLYARKAAEAQKKQH